jgi:hypothetical protein
MKTTNFEEILKRVETEFNTPQMNLIGMPNYEDKSGIFFHNLNQVVIPIYSQAELITFKAGDSAPILGAYLIEPESNPRFMLFNDSINDLSIKYADERSVINEVDIRNSLGFITAEYPDSPGLYPEEAKNRIEIIVKLQLHIFHTLHYAFGAWKTPFFTELSISYINNLVNCITKRTINDDENLLDCYAYKNTIPAEELIIENYSQFSKYIFAFDQSDWKEIVNLDVLINKIPESIWSGFVQAKPKVALKDYLLDNKLKFQDSFINWANNNTNEKPFSKIKEYLTIENTEKYRGSIIAEEYGN